MFIIMNYYKSTRSFFKKNIHFKTLNLFREENHMVNKMKQLVMEEEGQGLSEYGLVLAGVVTVVAAAIILLKDEITGLFTGLLSGD